MKATFVISFLRRAPLLLVCAAVINLPAPVRAASPAARLLQMQLPAGVTVPEADCAQLIRAVGLAVRAHRNDAPAILTAALTSRLQKGSRPATTAWPCACVSHLLRTAVMAAPEKAAALVEIAGSLAPDCAESLEETVQRLDDKNVIDGANGPGAEAPSDGETTGAGGPDFGIDPTASGVGIGPGFPGSPGFIGSLSGGAVALPGEPVAVSPDTNG